MRLQFITILAALGILAAVAPAQGERKAMEDMEKAFEKAIRTKDLSWFEKVAAPDYHETGVDGKVVNRSQSIAMMKQQFASGGKVTKMDAKIVKVTTKGKTTVALLNMVMEMSMTMPNAKKPSVIKSSMTYEETWTNNKGVWHIHHLKSLKESATLDGKPMPKGAMGGG